jgi:hypothetical protein
VRDVIGHNEIVFSPWHQDLVPRFRCMRHPDWRRRHMRPFRRELAARAKAAGVPVGDPPAWVDPGC